MLDFTGSLSPDQVKKLVEFDPANLDREMVKLSGEIGWYGTLLAKAKIAREKKKLKLDVTKAKLSLQFRKTAQIEGVKLTEGGVGDLVLSSDEYQQAWKEYMEAKELEEVLASIVTALEYKKDMIISYASMLKTELTSRVSIFNKPSELGGE